MKKSLAVCAFVLPVQVAASPQSERADLIKNLSNTFEHSAQFSDAFAPDFSAVQQNEPDKSVLIIEDCTMTALFASKQRMLIPPSGDVPTVGVTMTFDLTVSDLVPTEDGTLYGYSDGGFFERDKPQAESAQTDFAFGQIKFASRGDVTVVRRQTAPNNLSLEAVGIGPILDSTIEQAAVFTMTSAVSKARMQALVDAITSYKTDFCTLAS